MRTAASILTCDIVTVDTIWLRRIYVLAFLSVGSRRIEYLARNLLSSTTANGRCGS